AAPELPLQSVETMDSQIDRSLWRQRAAASLLSLFGVLALGLACAGIHGVLAQRVAQQTREIGIRMALGADRVLVIRQVIGQALRVTAAGLAIAVPLGIWGKTALATLLYGIGAMEPAVVVGVPLVFVAVAVAASFAPARRASGVDPAVALRQE
ncbi:MAG: FtsX-like permease family protein, partial [Bryobacteraceae bacterium]